MKTNIQVYKDRAVYASEMLDAYFPSAPNAVVSDIGAGYGHMQEKVISLGASWQPFDYVRKIEQSIIWDLNNACPPEGKKAGVVLFLEVLEHLANPLLSLQHIADHIEKGGILILTTPNPSSAQNTVNLFLKGRLFAFQEKHLAEHHVFTPWEHIVKFFLTNCGFEVLDYSIVDISNKFNRNSNINGMIKRRMEAFIESRNPKAQGMSYGIVARKI